MKNSYIRTKPKIVIDVTSIVTIHYFEFGPTFAYAGERHDFWELVYVDKGIVSVQRDGETLTLKQGEILFHAPKEFHAIRALNSSPNFFIISFYCTSPAMARFVRYRTWLDKTLNTYLASIIKEAEKTYRIPKNDPDLKKLALRENALVGGEQLIKTYLEQFLIFLLRSMISVKAPSFPQKDAVSDPLIASVRQYLAAQVEKNIRIEDLCREFGYSRSYLSHRFQSKTGQTLAAYAMELKIDEAKRLMRETDLNLSQISARLAFENPQYFSRVFKRVTGMTPTEFKKRAYI